jgi:hypothetical protein
MIDIETLRDGPYTCQVCGQVEQPIWDDDLEVEVYADPDDDTGFFDDDGREPLTDDLRFDMHEFEFKSCRIWIRVCEECSKIGPEQIFERYKQRIRLGEIARFH